MLAINILMKKMSRMYGTDSCQIVANSNLQKVLACCLLKSY